VDAFSLLRYSALLRSGPDRYESAGNSIHGIVPYSYEGRERDETLLPGCRGLTRGSFGSFWLNSSQHNVYVTRRSSPLPLPAFSIIRKITHFPSNLTPQNSRKCARALSLISQNSVLTTFAVMLDLIHNVMLLIAQRARTEYENSCEFVCVISRRTPRRQTMLMRWLSPLYCFLASGLSLCSPPGLLIPQGIQSPNARIRLARRATHISSRNQAEGIFPSKEIAIFVGDVEMENCHIFYLVREMRFSERAIGFLIMW